MYIRLPLRTILGALGVLVSVASCATLLDEDGVYSMDNPCDLPDLPPLDCGTGICRNILPACINGLPQTCPSVTANFEFCNGLDDDCNGLIDERCSCMDGALQNCYSGASVTRNVGVCLTGVQACTNGVWSECSGDVLPELENCNDDFDNDCNGAVNDKCACTDGQTHPCYGGPPFTQGVSNCRGGTQTCINGVWSDCKSDIVPGVEVCDGIDNDCDGIPDNKLNTFDPVEGCDCSGIDTRECYTGDTIFLGIGVCKKGYYVCKGGKYDTVKCLEEVLPGAEICNGLDDDCNGIPDDVPGLGLDCQTKLPGLCQFGKMACGIDELTGLPGTICLPNVQPGPEVACNLVDENCDGAVDEGTGCCPNDNIQNGSETDVNCGQGCPQQCPEGRKCAIGADCVSQVCASGSCVASKCTDGVQNGTETDIDCGGTRCDGCPATKKCISGADCLSSVCMNGHCT